MEPHTKHNWTYRVSVESFEVRHRDSEIWQGVGGGGTALAQTWGGMNANTH